MNSKARNVGIIGMELYVPKSYVAQDDLEKFYGASKGKFTIGLGQTNMSFVHEFEDVNSMALTVVKNLLDKYNVDPKNVGRLEVGTETIIDKSKSTKTVLMKLFAESGNHDIDGISAVNACYGGTSALFNAVNWIQSDSWDGRLAIVVASDIALYAKGPARPTGGAGAIAMLVGPDALFVLERNRSHYMDHSYDFYKPDIKVEYPTVDGPLTVVNFNKALGSCYLGLKLKEIGSNNQELNLDAIDYTCFHTPYCKQTFKCFKFLLENDLKTKALSGKHFSPEVQQKIQEVYSGKGDDKTKDAIFKEYYKQKCHPSLRLSTNTGNIYTGSLYLCLISLISDTSLDLTVRKHRRNKRILMFSYGSGLASAMFTLRVNGDISSLRPKLDVKNRYDSRIKFSAKEYDDLMESRKVQYGIPNRQIQSNLQHLEDGAFYLTAMDEKFRRFYERKNGNSPLKQNKTSAILENNQEAFSKYTEGIRNSLPEKQQSKIANL